jgi:CelD/BcsL family acetyltransferase involved in cellulose biosynthesis
MLRRCAEADLARMLMLWKGVTPVAGVASLVNRKRRSMCLYVTSFDEAFSPLSPGRVTVALDAIGQGMTEFDFLRGEEPYKFQFGAVSRHNRTLIVERPTLQAAVRRAITGVRETLRI